MESSERPDNGDDIHVQLPANTPFDKKWDILKPVIEVLYLNQNMALPEIVKRMKAEYGFAAE